MAISKKPLTTEELDKLEGFEEPASAREMFPYFKLFLMGPQGVGKSVFSYCFGRTLGLTLDNGWEVIKNFPQLEEKVDFVRYQGLNHFNSLARALLTQSGRYTEYNTYVIDTVAQVQEQYIDTLMTTGNWDKNMRPKFNYNNPALAVKKGNLYLPGGDDYHAARNDFREAIQMLTDAPVNVIYITHTKKPGALTPKEKQNLIIPNITEGLDIAIGRSCGLRAHMETRVIKGEQVRVLDFITTKELEAKSRIMALHGKVVRTETAIKEIAKWQGVDYYTELPSTNKISDEAPVVTEEKEV